MKKQLPNFYIILLLSTVLIGCGSQQKLPQEESSALQFTSASYQKWVAGIAGGGAGYALTFEMDESTAAKEVQMNRVYFKKWVTKINSKSPNVYNAMINDGTNNKMNSSLPDTGSLSKESERINTEEFSFELAENEAVIEYTEDGKRKYHKIRLTDRTPSNLPK